MALTKCCGSYPGYICDGCPQQLAEQSAAVAPKVVYPGLTNDAPRKPPTRRTTAASTMTMQEAMFEHRCPSCGYPHGVVPPVRAGLTCGTCWRMV
jgi:hypothetical protein